MHGVILYALVIGSSPALKPVEVCLYSESGNVQCKTEHSGAFSAEPGNYRIVINGVTRNVTVYSGKKTSVIVGG